jgi:hypothetical protein
MQLSSRVPPFSRAGASSARGSKRAATDADKDRCGSRRIKENNESADRAVGGFYLRFLAILRGSQLGGIRPQALPCRSDKDEVPGSSPGRPTTDHRRSQRCRHRARSARWLPGPRWGRTPVPAGTLISPAGPVHPGGRRHDHHAPWSPTQPRTAATPPVRQRRAAAGSRAHSAAASDGRSAHGLAHLVGQQASAPAALTQPGPGLPLTNGDRGSVARVQACSAVDRAAPRHGSPQGPRPVPMVQGAPPHRPGPQHHRLVWDETDASGRTGADTRRLDTGRRTAGPGRRTQLMSTAKLMSPVVANK